jgi:hypothetical protein
VALETPASKATSEIEGAAPVASIFFLAMSSKRSNVACLTNEGANGLSGVGGWIFGVIRVNQYKKEQRMTFKKNRQALVSINVK